MSARKTAPADAPAQDAVAQPDTKPAADSPEQQAPAPEPSEREKQLADELAEVTAQRDGFKAELDATTAERDEARRERDEARAELDELEFEPEVDEDEPEADEDEAPAEPSREDQVKALLIRYGLKKAYILPGDHVCFEESHAKHVAGGDFDSLPVISVD